MIEAVIASKQLPETLAPVDPMADLIKSYQDQIGSESRRVGLSDGAKTALSAAAIGLGAITLALTPTFIDGLTKGMDPVTAAVYAVGSLPGGTGQGMDPEVARTFVHNLITETPHAFDVLTRELPRVAAESRYLIYNATILTASIAGLNRLFKGQETRRQEIKNGERDLKKETGKDVVGIMVGKADPTVIPLVELFKGIDIDCVLYCDEENLYSKENPLWVKTKGDYTLISHLIKGAIEKTRAVFAEASDQYDLFLSSRQIDSKNTAEDIDDTKVFDTTEVIRANLGKSPPVISVTNPKRVGTGVTGGDSKNAYGSPTVEEIAKQYPAVELLDPDTDITIAIAEKNIAALPLELYTDTAREAEYTELLRDHVIPEHNERRVNSKEIRSLQYKTPDDKHNTFTIIYGADDTTTQRATREYIASRNKIIEQNNGQEPVGDYLVLVNHRREIDRLPEEAKVKGREKYICIGDIMAQKQFAKFIELVKDGKVKLSKGTIKKMIEKKLLVHDPSEDLGPDGIPIAPEKL